MTNNDITFESLGLPEQLLKSLDDLNYKKPSPIQTACIPKLLEGQDVLGMAQTGSGKTAAFALPALMKIDPKLREPQVLVLAPTRELAIQVASACSDYAKYVPGISVLPIYGGSRYDTQLRALRQGAQIIVGTPGRLLDHLKRSTLNLSHLRMLVLDEADEMLRMGFIDDVESILANIPLEHQTALFSATMPDPIRRITKRFMNNPFEIKIQSTTHTVPDITQSYWRVNGLRKTEALVRFLEVEQFDAAIIFVKTKTATLDVAEVLEKSGYSCAALNGDMNQALREQTLERLKDGRLNILIATDVAARGLDVERISLVINYDIPMDTESYVHRIGRTGRAGRAGRALLFVENRERRLLQNIERMMKTSIPEIELPTSAQLSKCRIDRLSVRIQAQLESADLADYLALLPQLTENRDIDPMLLCAALLKLAQGDRPLIVPPLVLSRPSAKRREFSNNESSPSSSRRQGQDRDAAPRGRRSNDNSKEMDLYRIEVGRDHGVEIRHIVGAIANEGDINSRLIGNIKLHDSYSMVELPKGMPKELIAHFTKTRVLNHPMKIRFISEAQSAPAYNNTIKKDRPVRRKSR